MQAKTIAMNETTGICGIPAKNGKMKVEQEFAGSDLAKMNNCQLKRATNKQRQEGSPAHLAKPDEQLRMPETQVGKEVSAMDANNGDLETLCLTPGEERKPSVEIDVAKYQAYLDDPALSEDQKEEIIKALWSIMVAFVDLGFGVHPAQEVCGKPASKLDVGCDKDSNESKPVDTLSKAFERASDDT